MKKIVIYTHLECLLKDNGKGHPERKERLETVLKSIKESNIINIEIKEAPLANVDEISLVHPIKYIESIFSLIPSFSHCSNCSIPPYESVKCNPTSLHIA